MKEAQKKERRIIMTLRGVYSTKQVFLDRRELKPDRSLQEIKYSPDGFAWGNHGSGASQLALAVLLEYFDKEKAMRLHQKFKEDIVAHMFKDDFEFVFDLADWVKMKEGR